MLLVLRLMMSLTAQRRLSVITRTIARARRRHRCLALPGLALAA